MAASRASKSYLERFIFYYKIQPILFTRATVFPSVDHLARRAVLTPPLLLLLYCFACLLLSFALDMTFPHSAWALVVLTDHWVHQQNIYYTNEVHKAKQNLVENNSSHWHKRPTVITFFDLNFELWYYKCKLKITACKQFFGIWRELLMLSFKI